MTENRRIRKVVKSRPTIEGAGVHLRRAFGFGDAGLFDPFLLLDDFRSDDPRSLPEGLPLAPAPRHRDHHLRAARRRRARRQPGQQRRHLARATCSG